MQSKAVIYYTDFSANDDISDACAECLLANANIPIYAVGQGRCPLPDFNRSGLVKVKANGGPRCYESLYNNILEGLKYCSEDFVFLCEHDILYPKEYFTTKVPSEKHVFEQGVACLFKEGYYDFNAYGFTRFLMLSFSCYRLKLIDLIEKKLEMWRDKKPAAMNLIWQLETFFDSEENKVPMFAERTLQNLIIDIRHLATFSGFQVDSEAIVHDVRMDDACKEGVDKIDRRLLRSCMA